MDRKTMYRKAALAKSKENHILSFDSDAEVTKPNGLTDGAYIQAWIWVPAHYMRLINR